MRRNNRTGKMMSLISRLIESLRDSDALQRGTRYLLACSGGVDSTTLAHLLLELSKQWDLALTLAYIHHGLRLAADEEIEFVRSLAASLGTEFMTRSVDVQSVVRSEGSSVQDVARRLRYQALEEMRIESGSDWILTAHHADDQAETLLLHFLKGAGMSGLAGIRKKHGNVIRPLLFASRDEIFAYAGEKEISWVEDESNKMTKYLRNIVRSTVLPEIKKTINPGVTGTLSRTADLFASLDEFLMKHVEFLAKESIQEDAGILSLAVHSMKRYLEFQQFLLIRYAIEHIRKSEATYSETNAVQQLLDKETGAVVQLVEGFMAFRQKDCIVIAPNRIIAVPSVNVSLGQEIEIPQGLFKSRRIDLNDVRFVNDPTIEFVDLDDTGTEWRLRAWNDGDFFVPLGFGRRKKISDFFVDQNIPSRLKPTIPILERDGEVIWICGFRLDDRFRITDTTKNVACLQFHFHQAGE